MNEPEPSAVANGSPPQASPFPFGPAADPTPTDDAGNPLRRMAAGHPFLPGARTIPAGGGQRDTLQNANFTHQHRCNPSGRMQRDENPLRRGAFTMEMRGSFCCPTRFAFARQPRKTQESDTSRLQKASNFISSGVAAAGSAAGTSSVPSGLCGAAASDSLRADRPPSASRASERLWGTSRAHVRAA